MSRIDELIAEMCPNGVEFKALGEIGVIFGGLSGKSKTDFSNGNGRFVSYVNVFNNIEIDFEVPDSVKIEAGERQRTLQRGDILFTGSSETANEVGMSSVITLEVREPLYLNSFCIGYRLNDPDILDASFAKYLFRSNEIRKQIVKTASGVTRFNISKVRLAEVKVPVPPLGVQREIVKVLDTFTRLEAELEAELEARRRQYTYYRDALLNFVEHSSDASKQATIRWATLGEVITALRTGLNPRQNFKLNPPGADNYYVTVRELAGFDISIGDKTDRVDSNGLALIQNRSKLQAGDILFSGTGTIGRTALLTEKPNNWNVKEGVYVITPNTNHINARFLIYLFHSSNIRKQILAQADGSTVVSIPMAALRKVRIPIPPLEEQQRIVAILDKFDALVNDISTGLPAEIKARRQQYEHYRDRLLTFKEA